LLAWGFNTSGQCNVPPLPAGQVYSEVAAGSRYTVARIGPAAACKDTAVSFCVAKSNSLGCLPLIESSGSPSASACSGFLVHGRRVLNRRRGLLGYSVTGRSALPFQGGTLCLADPIHKSTPVSSEGSLLPINDCTGTFSIDFSAFAAGKLGGNPLASLRVPGTLVQCQWWGRDPGFASPNDVSLSSGLEFTTCP
jgi:hypothetical protein